jgi:hypothetical protein
MSPDQHIAEVAARQHGVFTATQARDCGFTEATIRQRRRAGRWTDLHPRVFVIAGAPDSWQRRLSAATLARPRCVASHESAARLHRMRYVDWTDQPTISTSRSSRLLDEMTVHRRVDLDRCGRELIGGFDTTDRPTTLIDLAATVRPRRYVRIVDDQLASRQVAIDELVHRFDALAARGKPGIAVARSVIDERAAGYVVATSELEHIFRERVIPHVAARAVFQFLPPWRTDGIGRVDVAFPDHRLIVELDGRRWHLRDEHWNSDQRRDQEALAHGWVVVRYTYRQIRDEAARVADNLACILVRGAVCVIR